MPFDATLSWNLGKSQKFNRLLPKLAGMISPPMTNLMQSSKNMWVRWLRGALRNLDQEASYIARDNPKAAAEFSLSFA
jgi:hypothetical protein